MCQRTAETAGRRTTRLSPAVRGLGPAPPHVTKPNEAVDVLSNSAEMDCCRERESCSPVSSALCTRRSSALSSASASADTGTGAAVSAACDLRASAAQLVVGCRCGGGSWPRQTPRIATSSCSELRRTSAHGSLPPRARTAAAGLAGLRRVCGLRAVSVDSSCCNASSWLKHDACSCSVSPGAAASNSPSRRCSVAYLAATFAASFCGPAAALRVGGGGGRRRGGAVASSASRAPPLLCRERVPRTAAACRRGRRALRRRRRVGPPPSNAPKLAVSSTPSTSDPLDEQLCCQSSSPPLPRMAVGESGASGVSGSSTSNPASDSTLAPGDAGPG
eukprot:COSAG05_NODE_245_length_12989_cov_32.994725_8_plen_333_part_00